MTEANGIHVYVPEEERPELEEMKEFCKEHKINPSRMMMVPFLACWPTIKNKAAKERSFKLNGRTVII